MHDEQIIDLYWARNEQGITETKRKYGQYCYTIAYNILHDPHDAEECENDTYLAVWNAIPPQRPKYFPAFLGKITRNLSLKRLRDDSAQKRGGGVAVISANELMDCIPSGWDFQELLQAREVAELINTFLRSLPERDRRIFVCRYWYCDSIEELCRQFGYGKSKVKMILMRTRNKLQEFLKKEGVIYEET